ncbi:MAG TPA: type II secretion system protein GspE, partial [Sulfitobacter sp.]|nr:type II secretion system protein GspE [Sulfitobacter sp.]
MTHASTQTRLSYGFAQSQGVILLPASEDRAEPRCQYRHDASFEALIEAQRVSGTAVTFEEISAADFEAALGTIYRDSASEAAQVAADADDDLAS